MEKFSVLIIGGGASGMMCALRLAESGVRGVAILEKNERLGRKLSATGNGQGNVTNEDMASRHYFSSTGSAENVLKRFGKSDLLQYLSKLGGLFGADEVGRVYPASRQASSVTDLFRFALARAGVRVLTGETVLEVRKGADFSVRTKNGEYGAKYLVLACGGKASPHFGSDGDGYRFASSFGHTITPLFPSLVRLRTEQTDIRALKGIRSYCAAELIRKEGGRDKTIAVGRGDVLFTDAGVSGDLIFRLSAFCAQGDKLYLNFLPDFSKESVFSLLSEKARYYAELGAEDLLRGVVNSAIGRVVLKRCGISSAVSIRKAAAVLPTIVKMLFAFELTIGKSEGFENAQVTKGGVSMRELDDRLMSKKCDRLYIIGETVDVDGECGGYNLQWAFSSGAVAAEAIKERECNAV